MICIYITTPVEVRRQVDRENIQRVIEVEKFGRHLDSSLAKLTGLAQAIQITLLGTSDLIGLYVLIYRCTRWEKG